MLTVAVVRSSSDDNVIYYALHFFDAETLVKFQSGYIAGARIQVV